METSKGISLDQAVSEPSVVCSVPKSAEFSESSHIGTLANFDAEGGEPAKAAVIVFLAGCGFCPSDLGRVISVVAPLKGQT